MKRIGLVLLVSLLLTASSGTPSRTQGPPTPKEIKTCQQECKRTYIDCVKNGGDEPLCEAAYAFCNDCCTGGCRPAK